MSIREGRLGYLSGKVEEWGPLKIRVKNHSRQYRSSTKPTFVKMYSAECPRCGKRERIKHILGSIYSFECNGTYENTAGVSKPCELRVNVDITTGMVVTDEIPQVAATNYNQVPPNFEEIDGTQFANILLQKQILAIGFQQFVWPNYPKNGNNSTRLFYTESDGSGLAICQVYEDGLWIPAYAKFAPCKHEWRALTPEERKANNVFNGMHDHSRICDTCYKIETWDSSG